MSADDGRRWDERYRAGDHASEVPAALLPELEPLLPARGRALDVAGGAGRHALWLARRGLEVTLCDIAPAALAIAGERARRAGVRLELCEADHDEATLPAGPFVLVVAFHFLAPSLFAGYARALAPGGLLVAAQPTTTNLERHARPGRRFLVAPGELASLARAEGDAFEVIHEREHWSPEGIHQAELVARRR